MEHSKVLVIGATGYIGKHITNASLKLGHPTFVIVRPELARQVEKVQLLLGFRRAGATIFWISLDDHASLVKALKEVDVVICTISHYQIQEQFKLIEAIKDTGNIKKFYPSEFGMDVDRHEHIAPGDTIFINKIKIRRAIEAAGIPYTYISANCFMGFFLASFAQVDPLDKFIPPRDKIDIHDDGNKKVVWIAEEDVGIYTIKTVDDPRTLNKIVYFRPPQNIITMNEQVSMWEQKINKTLEKRYMSKDEIFEFIQDLQRPLLFREACAHIYEIFYRGDLYFDIGLDGLEASVLYPDVEYTTATSYLDLYV